MIDEQEEHELRLERRRREEQEMDRAREEAEYEQAYADAALGRALREAFGDGVNVEEAKIIRDIVHAAQLVTSSKSFQGICDEDVMLERAVDALGRLRSPDVSP